MTKPLLALACLAALTVAGCQPQTAAPADNAAAAEAAPASADVEQPIDVVPTGEPVSSENAAGFDQRAFAGTFSGTLPCASCPGIDTTLVLEGDGRYRLTETYQGNKGQTASMDGNWTAEEENRHIRLDPASKTEDDRLYAIESNDRLVLLGADGQPAESGLDYSLGRQPTE